MASGMAEHGKNWSLGSETTVWNNSFLYQFTEYSSKKKELQQRYLYIRSTLEIGELLLVVKGFISSGSQDTNEQKSYTDC